VNILPNPDLQTGVSAPEEQAASLPPFGFLLSAAPPCTVHLTQVRAEQTLPFKAPAELLADGQCEV